MHFGDVQLVGDRARDLEGTRQGVLRLVAKDARFTDEAPLAHQVDAWVHMAIFDTRGRKRPWLDGSTLK